MNCAHAACIRCANATAASEDKVRKMIFARAFSQRRASLPTPAPPRGSRRLIFTLRQRSAVKLTMKFREFLSPWELPRIEYGVYHRCALSGRHLRFAQRRDPRSRNSTRIRNPSAGRDGGIQGAEARFYISFDASRFVFSRGTINNRMASLNPRDRIVIAVTTTSDIWIGYKLLEKMW